MKPEKYSFWFIFVFFAIVTPIYWFVSGEIAGTFVLGATGFLGGFIAAFLTLQARNFDADRAWSPSSSAAPCAVVPRNCATR
ncbi:aa3-type cytochrome oxidase subunit IV [Tessaracoccus sp. Y36]